MGANRLVLGLWLSCACLSAVGQGKREVQGNVAVPDFAVAVKLSKAAEARLRDLKESVVVAAYFDGDGEPEPGVDTSPMRAVVLAARSDEQQVGRDGAVPFQREGLFPIKPGKGFRIRTTL